MKPSCTSSFPPCEVSFVIYTEVTFGAMSNPGDRLAYRRTSFSHPDLWLLSSFVGTPVNFQVLFDVLLAVFLSYMGCEIVLIFNKASPLRNRFNLLKK